MLLAEAIRTRIRFYLEKNDMTLWELYKASGVPKSTVFALMNPKKKTTLPKLITLHHICEGFRNYNQRILQ